MKTKIKVDYACSENWNDMLPNKNGKFCLNCQKNIIDFTQQNSQQIVDYLQQNQNVCGRIKQSQIDAINSQNALLPKSTPRNRWFWTIGLGALLGISQPVLAQTNETIIQQNKSDSKNTSTDVEQITISGRVTDLNFGDPIPDVLITIENTEIKTYTDKDGKYNLTFDKDLDKETLVTYNMPGFKKQTLPIRRISPFRNLKLEESEAEWIGEIIINKY